MQSSMAKLFPLLLAVAVTLLITHGLAHAQVTQTVTLTAGQTGRIAFETTTMTDAQFLKGEKKGSPARIWGICNFPSA